MRSKVQLFVIWGLILASHVLTLSGEISLFPAFWQPFVLCASTTGWTFVVMVVSNKVVMSQYGTYILVYLLITVISALVTPITMGTPSTMGMYILNMGLNHALFGFVALVVTKTIKF